MKKALGGKMHNTAKPGAVKVGSAPFSANWSNSKPAARSGGLTSSPAGSQTQYRDKGRGGLFKGRGSKGA